MKMESLKLRRLVLMNTSMATAKLNTLPEWMEIIGAPVDPKDTIAGSLSPTERAEVDELVIKLKAERDSLTAKSVEWMKDIKALPEWKHWRKLKREVDLARKHTMQTFDADWAADEAEDELWDAIEEEEEYRPIVKAAIKALPFGEEYLAAQKRLKELKWLT